MTLDLGILFVIGCIEWGLAALRTVACARGRANAAALLVFCEMVLGLGVLRYVLQDNPGGNWPAIVAYSLGGALGVWCGIRRSR